MAENEFKADNAQWCRNMMWLILILRIWKFLRRLSQASELSLSWSDSEGFAVSHTDSFWKVPNPGTCREITTWADDGCFFYSHWCVEQIIHAPNWKDIFFYKAATRKAGENSTPWLPSTDLSVLKNHNSIWRTAPSNRFLDHLKLFWVSKSVTWNCYRAIRVHFRCGRWVELQLHMSKPLAVHNFLVQRNFKPYGEQNVASAVKDYQRVTICQWATLFHWFGEASHLPWIPTD